MTETGQRARERRPRATAEDRREKPGETEKMRDLERNQMVREITMLTSAFVSCPERRAQRLISYFAKGQGKLRLSRKPRQ